MLAQAGLFSTVPAGWTTGGRIAGMHRGFTTPDVPVPLVGEQFAVVKMSDTASLDRAFVVPFAASCVVDVSFATRVGAESTDAVVRLRTAANGATGTAILLGEARSVASPGWTTYAINMVLTAAGPATVSLGSLGPSSAYFDDVRLRLRRDAHWLQLELTEGRTPEGRTARLDVLLGGEPPVTARWQREVEPGVFVDLADGALAGVGNVSGAASTTLLLTALRPGVHTFRAVATNACGESASAAVPVVVQECSGLDFNNDGIFPSDEDLVDFLRVLAGGACSTEACNSIDFNGDGIFPADEDLLAFLRVLAGEAC